LHRLPIITFGPHDVSHAFGNDMGLVFCVVTPRVLAIGWGPRLAQVMRAELAKLLGSGAGRVEYDPEAEWPAMFGRRWEKMMDAFAGESDAGAARPVPRGPGSGKFGKHGGKRGDSDGDDDDGDGDGDDDESRGSGAAAAAAAAAAASDGDDAADPEERKARKLMEARAALRRKANQGGGSSSSPRVAASNDSTSSSPKDSQDQPPRKRGGKDKRSWVGKAAKGNEAAALDFSDDKHAARGRGTHDPMLEAPIDLDDFGPAESPDADANAASGGVMGYFRKLIGNRPLTREDLTEPLEQLKSKLVTKNVAPEIAGKLCSSVQDSLVGTKLGTFGSAAKELEAAMEAALTTVLTPKRNVDILREVADARKDRRLYTIVFVGVNGVGKSTSLSKTCFWLLQNKLKVMIAACDTFRAGAVEQLGEHCRRLDVPLFQKGYGKDAAAVARDGVEHAKQQGMDVLLIDTAGRMQGNEPLMRSLAKLVSLNRPDLILFVGEALVGTDGVDQVVEFNRAMNEYSTDKNPRLIDGIFLTKFDTIDEKVGAALSMVYSTGQPVVFLGVGQQYPDLRRMNVKAVVRSLLS
jgi:signal recognition particle receptor subunit alpha